VHTGIVDLTFRITNCRFLLAIVSRTSDLVCINLSFASRDFVCARSSDVVETVTSETETWLKFRDETETETLS